MNNTRIKLNTHNGIQFITIDNPRYKTWFEIVIKEENPAFGDLLKLYNLCQKEL